MLAIKIATGALQEDLRQRASKKREIALAESKRKRALAQNKKPVRKQESGTPIELLKEILSLLKKQGKGSPKFIVTERDANGNVKAFEVER